MNQLGLSPRTGGFIKVFSLGLSSGGCGLANLRACSERYLRGQLDDARAASTQTGIDLRLVRGLSDQALVGGARNHEEIRQGKIRMVQNVKELRPQFESEPFGNSRILARRKVDIPKVRTIDGVVAQVAKGCKWRIGESRSVQIADRVRSRLPVGTDWIHSRNYIGALVEIREGGKDAGICSAGVIGVHDGNRPTALRARDGIELPAGAKTLPTGKPWQVVGKGSGETVAGIEAGRSMLRRQIIRILGPGDGREVEVDSVGSVVQRLRPGVTSKSGKPMVIPGAERSLQRFIRR